MAHAMKVPLAALNSRPMASDAASGAARGGVRWMLRAEGFALFVVATAIYARLGLGGGFFVLMFLAPDLSFAAYLAGPRWGAAAYNSLHSTLAPLVLAALGWGLQSQILELLALVGLAHIGFDRALGYGLKYASAFGDTHLGHTGKTRA